MLRQPFIFTTSVLVRREEQANGDLIALLMFHFFLVSRQVNVVPKKVAMIVTVVHDGARLSYLRQGVAATAGTARHANVNAGHSHVSLRYILNHGSVSGASGPFYVVLKAEVNGSLSILSQTNQRAFRCVKYIITARWVKKFTVRVSFVVKESFRLSFVLTVRHSRQGLARRFRHVTNFDFQIIFRTVDRFVSFRLRRQLLNYCNGLFWLLHVIVRGRLARVRSFLTLQRYGYFLNERFPWEFRYRRVLAQLIRHYHGLTVVVADRRFREVLQYKDRDCPRHNVECKLVK